MTYDELHTALVEVEAILNSRPISYISSEDMDEPLTPSHLLLGHRLCTLPCSVTRSKDPASGGSEDLSRRMQHLNQILEHFWKRWRSEYLMGLRESHAHSQKPRNGHRTLALGEVVLIYNADQPRTQWRIGRVEGLLEGSDGAVRGASLRVQSGKKTILLNRPIQHLYPLETSIAADANTCATDQASVVRDEEDTELSHTAASDGPKRVSPTTNCCSSCTLSIKGVGRGPVLTCCQPVKGECRTFPHELLISILYRARDSIIA